MTTVVFCLEEPSARAMLEGVIPRLFPDVQFRFVVFEGKQDLHKRLVMLYESNKDSYQVIKYHIK